MEMGPGMGPGDKVEKHILSSLKIRMHLHSPASDSGHGYGNGTGLEDGIGYCYSDNFSNLEGNLIKQEHKSGEYMLSSLKIKIKHH